MLFKSYALLACLAYGAGSFVLALPILLRPLVTSLSDRIGDVASFERRTVDTTQPFGTDTQGYVPTNRLTVRDLLLAILVDRELDAMYPVSTRAGGKVTGSIISPGSIPERRKEAHRRVLHKLRQTKKSKLPTIDKLEADPPPQVSTASKAAPAKPVGNTPQTATPEDSQPGRWKRRITCRITVEGVNRCFKTSRIIPNSITELESQAA